MQSPNVSRRSFLRLGAATGAGLILGFRWPASAQAASKPKASQPDQARSYSPNAYLRIGTDNSITVLIPKSEMGQGVLTSLAMIVAEELDVDWSRVCSEEANGSPSFRWGVVGMMSGQITEGSESVREGWNPLRAAGAGARTMLIEAAAETWGVPADSCHTELGEVVHAASGRRVTYGSVAERASQRGAPWRAKLKDPRSFRIVGQRIARLDTPSKVDGTAVYGIDVRLPGMQIACVARCPVFGGKVATFDAKHALAIKGVSKVFAISNGVAVVATNYWAARKGVDALAIQWAEGPNASYSTAQQRRAFLALAQQPGRDVFSRGDAAGTLKLPNARRIDTVYELPFLAHATMEPQNCTAHVTANHCEVWAPTQAQTGTQQTAAAAAGLAESQVEVHTTFLGCGFGRRSETDFVREAVETSKIAGIPIKLIWSRPDDMHHDFYRPASTTKISGAVDAAGWPIAWKHHVVAQSVLERVMPGPVFALMHDPLTFAGLADDFPYHVPHMHMAATDTAGPIPVGFWRSVGFSHNVYVVEHFLDELAHLGGKDPLAVRRRLMTEHPRLLAVLELAAHKAGWGTPLPAGHFRGVAACSPFGSHVAQVVEVSVQDGEVRVHRVVAAVDCGQVINPAIVEAQIEGGIVFGLSAALKGEITFEHGRVQQNNFDSYEVLRMNEMPAVEVHIVPSTEAPGGIGETGVPCVAPAIANALLLATGQPYRSLPFKLPKS